LGNPRIREENVEILFLALNLRVEPVEIAGIRHISTHTGRISPNLLDSRCEFLFATAGDVNVGSLFGKCFRRRKADPTRPARYQCYFCIQFWHSGSFQWLNLPARR
jgi:hypothetical protein